MVKLYWWRAKNNFGDALSVYIIQALFGIKVKWANPQLCLHREFARMIRAMVKGKSYKLPSFDGYVLPWQKSLFAIGSILDGSSYKTLIWGSGFREYNSKFRGGRIYAVRGYLTLNLLPDNINKKNIALGDIALLLPLVYSPQPTNRKLISIVPHFVEYEYFKSKYGKAYSIVDVRTTNVECVIDQICNSRFILSTSLHGIIVAQAYRIPALWIRKGWINSSDFKFHDYFSAVGIPQYDGFCNIDEILSNEYSVQALFDKNKDKSLIHKDLECIQKHLIRTFPYDYCMKNR